MSERHQRDNERGNRDNDRAKDKHWNEDRKDRKFRERDRESSRSESDRHKRSRYGDERNRDDTRNKFDREKRSGKSFDDTQESRSSHFEDDIMSSFSLYSSLTTEERIQAEKIAKIATLAEERSRKANKNQQPKSLEDMARDKKVEEIQKQKVEFISRAEREKRALERLQQSREKAKLRIPFQETLSSRQSTTKKEIKERESSRECREKEKELDLIRDHYLGKKVKKKKIIKASEKFSKIFQFDWEASEDTSQDINPLYSKKLHTNLLFGRGYRAGTDLREQRQANSFLEQLTLKRQKEERDEDEKNKYLSLTDLKNREKERELEIRKIRERESQIVQLMEDREAETMGIHWSDKTLSNMTERDWRIFREDFDISVSGGKCPHPIRNWEEAKLPDSITNAIAELKFDRPSPIQMQAIPIGLQRRDVIGIAETGSGKTAAFIIPIIAYMNYVPQEMLNNTAEEGPLAIVMAPTRELALQIEQEAIKLIKYVCLGEKQEPMRTVAVVGGQNIGDQAFKLRQGIHLVIATPGRLIDCIESRYVVLNQCRYVVLDEADRMIDMGFEPQVIAVLENMGGILKSENAEEMEHQIKLSIAGETHKFRVTTMFSATMPVEVERLAKTYLRHPAIVKIGDEDSGKNKRIDQQVIFLASSKKRNKLIEVLKDIVMNDDIKIIVFVNVKKECDVIARFVSQQGFRPTVLHGGKTQDQREESLQGFRDGVFDLLVATDVAGRGLDIPDVTHVINYDMPSKIDSYCHRIGRTGRAGKEGVAITFLTDQDQEVFYYLKQYLISTNATIPEQLAHHSASKNPPDKQKAKR